MSHNHPTPNQPAKTRRKTAFAVGAVIALVGIAFAATLYVTDDEPMPAHALGSGSATDPITSLTALSAPLPGLDGAAAGAAQASGRVQTDATADVEASISDAQSRVDAAISDTSDILAGTDGGIDAHLDDLRAYSIAELRARLQGQAGTSFLWNSMPSTVSLDGDEVHLEETGHAEVDAALLQAEALLAQIQAMYGGAEVQSLFSTVDQTAAEAGAPVRIPGLIKSPFGADSAVEPDEDGALIARAHAEALLSTVDGGYGNLHASLEQAHASQAGLAAEVDAALSAAAQFKTEAHKAVDADHLARVDAVKATGDEYVARLDAAAQAYVSDVGSVAAEAEAELEATLAQQVASIENASADAQAQIDAGISDVRSEAEARLAGIAQAEADVQAAVEAGAVSAADASAFFAASADAQAQIEAQVSGAEAAAADLKAQVSATAEAKKAELEATIADARAELESRVADSHAWAESQVALLTGDVDGALEGAISAQADLQAAAKSSIDQAVVAHKAELETRAYAAVGDARAYAEAAQATVDQVQGEAYAEVGNDLGFILAVADDYGSIPTPERQAAADAWMTVRSQLDSHLGSVLVEGGKISAQADAVVAAAAEAEAALGSRF